MNWVDTFNIEEQAEPNAEQPKSSGRWWSQLCGFVTHGQSKVSPAATSVWLAMFRNSRNGIAQISIERLADTTGLNERRVRRSLRELVDLSIIEIVKRGGRNQGPTRYRLASFTTGRQCPLEESQPDTHVRPATGHQCPPSPREKSRGRFPNGHVPSRRQPA